ncbi:hypothetical protein L6452_00295 [Arctium lappa]|uniref:Uncharacterized protein n=1 Tax=Arctium lappa TaxID=4217 RepID=A0ACB9FEB3_ARCLA|nr:hypothetical protein L6452_00295 [Arctium lappa]
MASKSKKAEYPAFTNFTIKVEAKPRSWSRTVTRILNSVEGVITFKTEDDGNINISGYIEPTVLLKCLRKLGKSAHLVHWQYGECSNNMYVKKPELTTNKNGNGIANANGYCLYPGGYNIGYDYPGYGRNYDAYDQLEFAGNGCECNRHQIEKPKTPEKSASASTSTSKYCRLKLKTISPNLTLVTVILAATVHD